MTSNPTKSNPTTTAPTPKSSALRFRRKDNTPTVMTTIDLHLPTSWNGCTTADLEAIAAAIIQEQQRTDRYHPFDWSRVKLAVVLSINAMTVVADGRRAVQSGAVLGHDNAAARSAQPMVNGQCSMVNGHTFLVQRPQDKEPWPITTGQLVALTDRLAFLDDPKANRTIFAFPYPKLTFNVQRSTFNVPDDAQPMVNGQCSMVNGQCSMFNGQRSMVNGQCSMFNGQCSMVNVVGPQPLLDGYTWQEYRYLTDWMQEYMRCTNARQDATEPMAQFLAVLFKPAPDAQPMVNGQCSMVNGQCSMVNGQCSMVNGQCSMVNGQSSMVNVQWSMFAGFSPIKWQVILFWWSSLMALLQQKFPRVFKPQPVGRGRQQKKNETPWDFYNRVTAMLADEYKSSEADQQNETYGVTLQKLQNMADKAAELEKLKNKK